MNASGADEALTQSITALLKSKVENAAADIDDDLDECLQRLPLFPAERLTSVGFAAADYLERHPEAAVQIGIEFLAAESPAIRAFAVVVITRLSRFHPAIWKDLIRHALTDQVWEVRQLAAHAFDSSPEHEGAADFHFEFVLNTVHDWATDSEYLVRYAASQALLGHAARKPEIGQKILAAIDTLFNDVSEHVRFGALGALRVIGKRRPDLVFSFIELKLDTLGNFEREVYRQLLHEPFADKNAEWRDRIARALNAATPTQTS